MRITQKPSAFSLDRTSNKTSNETRNRTSTLQQRSKKYWSIRIVRKKSIFVRKPIFIWKTRCFKLSVRIKMSRFLRKKRDILKAINKEHPSSMLPFGSPEGFIACKVTHYSHFCKCLICYVSGSVTNLPHFCDNSTNFFHLADLYLLSKSFRFQLFVFLRSLFCVLWTFDSATNLQ